MYVCIYAVLFQCGLIYHHCHFLFYIKGSLILFRHTFLDFFLLVFELIHMTFEFTFAKKQKKQIELRVLCLQHLHFDPTLVLLCFWQEPLYLNYHFPTSISTVHGTSVPMMPWPLYLAPCFSF